MLQNPFGLAVRVGETKEQVMIPQNVRLFVGRGAALCAGLVLCLALQAATVQRIVITTGTGQAAPEELIRANMRTAEGQEFSPQVLSEDIKRIMETDYFADVETGVVERADGTVDVRVNVVMKPRVREIRYQGNEVMSTGKFEDVVELEEGALLDERQVSRDAGAVRQLYRDAGYNQTRVSYSVQPIPNTEDVNVVFEIEEEGRSKVRKVAFEGNTVFADKKLRKTVEPRHSWWSHIFRTDYLDEEKIAADKDRLWALYTAKGYLDFRVGRVERDYNKRGTWVRITFHLEEGEPYTVSQVAISGNRRFSDEELRKRIEIAPGERYDSTVEGADIERIRAAYEELGYLDLAVRAVHELDTDAHTVAIEYRIREGVPSTIRDVYVRGNDVTQDHVIRRELAIHPGDLGDAGRIRASRSRLMNLNYFESVDIVPVGTEAEDEKDLMVTVDEKRTGQLMVGAGFSSEDDIIGMFEITQANFDWDNPPRFTGGGQRLRLRMHVGTERDDYVLSFTEPWLLHKPIRFDWDAFAHERDQDEYTEARAGTGVRFTTRWRKFWRRSVGYQIQQVELEDFDNNLSNVLLDEEGSYTSSVVSFGLSRDTRDRVINPSRGSRLALSLDLQPEFLGGYTNMFRAGVEGTRYFPVFGEGVLKLEGEVGVVDHIGGDPVAIFDRFFAGGGYSVRGFDRREVGPADANGDPIGGRSLFTGTVEFIYPVYERVRASLFSDFGNVWWDVGDFNPGELNLSVGVGVQLDLPIGPVRLDYGIPVVTDQDHLDDANGRLHFNLGYFF